MNDSSFMNTKISLTADRTRPCAHIKLTQLTDRRREAPGKRCQQLRQSRIAQQRYRRSGLSIPSAAGSPATGLMENATQTADDCSPTRNRAQSHNVTQILTQAIKVLGMSLIGFLLVGRCLRLFMRWDGRTLAGALLLMGLVAWFGIGRAALLTLAILLTVFAALLHDMPTDNAGHRGGGHGYGGHLQENTIEALRALAACDAASLMHTFAYLELDIHETADGELVVFHDATLKRALPEGHSINAAPTAALVQQGLDARVSPVSALTAAQVQSFHLGGQEGCHVPTLQKWLRVCLELGITKSLAVEVKTLQSDKGRQKLLDLLQGYLQQSALHPQASDTSQLYAPFGRAAVIAFPWSWAKAVGEYRSHSNERWACRFASAGIPVKSCVMHRLSLIYGCC